MVINFKCSLWYLISVSIATLQSGLCIANSVVWDLYKSVDMDFAEGAKHVLYTIFLTATRKFCMEEETLNYWISHIYVFSIHLLLSRITWIVSFLFLLALLFILGCIRYTFIEAPFPMRHILEPFLFLLFLLVGSVNILYSRGSS